MRKIKEKSKNEKNQERAIHQSIEEKKFPIKEPPDVSRPPKIFSGDPSVPPASEDSHAPEDPQTPKEPSPNEEKSPSTPTQPPIVNSEKQSSYAYEILGFLFIEEITSILLI